MATILSAQSTDIQINKITQDLFRKYQGPEDFAAVPQEQLEEDVRSSGFYRNKAKNLKASSQLILEKFNGEVPDNMKDLLTLAGVARKTANIVLTSGFGKVEGIAVDTHVKRLSGRLGLTEEKNPDKVEKDLMEAFPKEDWKDINMIMILHGRRVCQAKKPMHDKCVLYDICPSKGI